MIKPFKLLSLLFCTLFTFSTLGSTRANLTTWEDFTFPDYDNETSPPMVKDGSELIKNTGLLSLLTLADLPFLFAICKAGTFVSGMTGHSKKNNIGSVKGKSDYCLKLASVMTVAEVALAGHVSPWPLEQTWWRPLRFTGVGVAIYTNYMSGGKTAPEVALTYLVIEATARTCSSIALTPTLTDTNSQCFKPSQYNYVQHVFFSVISGITAGAILYEILIETDVKPAKATSAFVITASIVSAMSALKSTVESNWASNESVAIGGVKNRAEAEALITTAVAVAAILGVMRMKVLECMTGAGGHTSAGAEAAAMVGALIVFVPAAAAIVTFTASIGIYAGAAFGVLARAEDGSILLTLIPTLTFALAGAELGRFFTLASSKVASNSYTTNAFITLASALGITLINSVCNYSVCGNSLENSLYETYWTLLKKFYAPLDYLNILSK